jgi:hypothetical protein
MAQADPPARHPLVLYGPCWSGSGKIVVDGTEYSAKRGIWQSEMLLGKNVRVSRVSAWCGARTADPRVQLEDGGCDEPAVVGGSVEIKGSVAIRDPNGGGVECCLWAGAGMIELEFEGAEVCSVIVR